MGRGVGGLVNRTSGSHLNQRGGSWEWDRASAEYAKEEAGGHVCACSSACCFFDACLIIAAMLIPAAL